MKTQLAAAFLTAAFTLAPAFASAQDETTLDHIVIEMASTPAQHATIARHYLANAQEARQEVRRHERMAQAYNTGKSAPKRGHCLRLAEKYGEIATEYEQLAKLHEEESKRAQ